MSCNCGDGDEYIIELGEVGIQGIQGPKGDTGYSPVVTYTINNDTLKFTLINEESTTDTPNFYNYVAKRDLSNTSYNADMLVVNNNINNLSTRLTSEVNRLDIADSEIRTNLSNLSTDTQNSITTINGDILSLQASYGALDRKVDSNMNTVTYRLDNRYTKSEVDNILLTYVQKEELKRVAFSGDYDDLINKPTIGNGSITIRQGGSTKGTFNVNQTGNTIIELDQGGGSTYTAGTGIDITNDTISVDNTVAMKTDIPDVSNFVTNSSLATTLGNYVDLSSNQTVLGTKSINDLNSSNIGIVGGDGAINAGRISYDLLTDQLQITSLSNRDINVIPNGTGKFLYNANEVATTNQIPTVNNNTITIKENGTTVDSFTLNQATDKNINITVPTKTSDLTNDSDFVAESDLAAYYTKTETDTLLDGKQDDLTEGNGIDITNDVISCDNTIARVSDIPDVTTKLNTDGSNADANFTVNGNVLRASGIVSAGSIDCSSVYIGQVNEGIQIVGSSISPRTSSAHASVEFRNSSSSQLDGKDAYIEVDVNGNVRLGSGSLGKAYYNSNEIATVDDIADKTSVYTVYDTEHFLITGNSDILNNILTINSGETGKITIPINTSLNSTIGLSYKIKMDPTAFGYIIDNPNYNILPCINVYQNYNSFDFWYPGKASSSGTFGSDWGTVEITLNKTTGACNFKLTDANDTVLVDTGFGYNNTQVADNTNWILDLNTTVETCTYKQIDLSTLTLTLDGVEYPCIPNNGKTTYSDLKVGDGLKVSRPKEYTSWVNPQMSSASQNGYVVTSNYNSSESGSANWKAFDKDTTTGENAWWTGMNATLPAWIQLEVPEAVIPTSCTIYNEVATPMNFKDGIIQGSNDGVNYTDLYTITNRPDTTGYGEEYPIVTNTAYKYLRVYCTSNWYSGVSIQEIIWKGKIPNTGDLNPKLSLDLTTIQGYSPTGTLVLKCINGVMQWVAET